jgi:predicted deacetylase
MDNDFPMDGHFFNDDGTEINPDLVPIPGLCLTCKKHEEQGDEWVLCTLNRADQADSEEFLCHAYEEKR